MGSGTTGIACKELNRNFVGGIRYGILRNSKRKDKHT